MHCGQTVGDEDVKMKRGMQVGLGLCHIVLDGDTASQKNFSAHVYHGQMAGCIKVPLGAQVCLGPGDIVLDGDPAPPQLRQHSPQFLAYVRCDQTAG